MIFNKYNNFIYKNTSINDLDFYENVIFKKRKVSFSFNYNKNVVHLFILLISMSYINYVFTAPLFKGLLKRFLIFDIKILNFLNKNTYKNFYNI